MSSPLKVLLLGDNPNIILYASRFYLAKNIELYHISSHVPHTIFNVETINYGPDKIQFQNNFQSINDLAKAYSNTSLFFDIIICSATSLQEISSLASQLNPMINLNTKIILESTGFVQIEPFFKLSLDLPQVNIFSMITDIDFRQVDANTFKQFPSNNSSLSNHIYLGCSSTDDKPTNSATFPVLDTFSRLFQKLFPHDEIDILENSTSKFLSKQWSLAIPRISYDTLLILLDGIEPLKLLDEILAKPLISGLTNELYGITRKMNITLDSKLSSEESLTSSWKSQFTGSKAIKLPQLAYHFFNNTAPLNLDLLLLQPILLADDHGVKTPYLEFLYSIMCQYEKYNKGTSKLFQRVRSQNNNSIEIEKLNQLKTENLNIMKEREHLKSIINSNENNVNQLKLKIDTLNQQLITAKQDLNQQSKNHEVTMKKLQELKQANPNMQTNSASQLEAPRTIQSQKQMTISPSMQELEDIAVYGVNFGESPQKPSIPATNDSSPQALSTENSANTTGLQEPTPPPDASGIYSNSSSNGSDRALREREIELRKKELELKERELDLQRRAVQQQQFQNNNGSMNSASMQQIHGSDNRIPSMGQQQQQQQQQQMNGRVTRAQFNASSPNLSTTKFQNNSSPTLSAGFNNGFNQMANTGANGQFNNKFQRTSRKNRNSNMAKIGNASNLNAQNMSFNNNIPSAGNMMGNGNRLNSLSSNMPPQQAQQQRYRNSQPPGLQGPSRMSMAGIGSQGMPNGPQPVRPNTIGMGINQRNGSSGSVQNSIPGNVNNLNMNMNMNNNNNLNVNNLQQQDGQPTTPTKNIPGLQMKMGGNSMMNNNNNNNMNMGATSNNNEGIQNLNAPATSTPNGTDVEDQANTSSNGMQNMLANGATRIASSVATNAATSAGSAMGMNNGQKPTISFSSSNGNIDAEVSMRDDDDKSDDKDSTKEKDKKKKKFRLFGKKNKK
ncbi:hypothetical protein TBLA_0A00330 [Henningerozyma blattae CBS 6284]|uniref:Ketopantoate reductase C-terminal domain-containing protein n=1 Tax=Henningerozyma blattae (strain ATCC 34711 / CBS 6284 / DSM 70876 / NBRC 10599 / NRRL Y-10934 / UCD 77-7) TaxID=1071380 RepID=I2GUN1_HENB6|nr:hypothetical protein TBLA_0A00330 [Tetrapisispora blattae CBS 6284]CCH57833.1 hypothetical protein TBLA_0A00330 [Tetrapisispora blattae CBS 6284]